jgi:hypothetical protein
MLCLALVEGARHPIQQLDGLHCIGILIWLFPQRQLGLVYIYAGGDYDFSSWQIMTQAKTMQAGMV